jgi:hypothetical protein
MRSLSAKLNATLSVPFRDSQPRNRSFRVAHKKAANGRSSVRWVLICSVDALVEVGLNLANANWMHVTLIALQKETMKVRPTKTQASPFPPSPAPEVPAFGTGQVAEILGLPIWRVQKFLDSPRYNLSPEGQLGTGHGSRRVYTRDDILRIAIAARMVEDGFTASLVGSTLGQFEDSDFYESHDQDGNELPPFDLLTLRRADEKPVLKLFASARPPKLGEKDSPYYILNLGEIIEEIDKRIARIRK